MYTGGERMITRGRLTLPGFSPISAILRWARNPEDLEEHDLGHNLMESAQNEPQELRRQRSFPLGPLHCTVHLLHS
jgi:hypothetical protein